MTDIRAQVVCVDCGRTFRGTLVRWPSDDPAERWRIPWHKRPNPHGGTMVCRGYWRLDHRRFDIHREAS